MFNQTSGKRADPLRLINTGEGERAEARVQAEGLAQPHRRVPRQDRGAAAVEGQGGDEGREGQDGHRRHRGGTRQSRREGRRDQEEVGPGQSKF